MAVALSSSTEAATPFNVGGIHSQAGNFLSAMQSSVDPRTGQFNLSISITLGSANDLSGPSFPVTVTFSSLASHQNRGFGLGWSLLVSELSLAQNAQSLRLSTGEQFAVQPGPEGSLAFLDYKLQSLQLTRLESDTYRIAHKNGQTEYLKRVNGSGAYVLHELRTAQGRALYLSWRSANGVNYLDEIQDDNHRVMARLDRTQSSARLLLEPDTPQQSVVTFQLANDRLSRLLLPDTPAPCTFAYEQISVAPGMALLFPTAVENPLGGRDEVIWSKSASDSHRLPIDAPITFLPRVLSWAHQDGAIDQTLSRRYTWVGVHNHLGYGSQHGYKWEAGRDNLYKVRSLYQYAVTETLSDPEGRLDVRITRTWDRYHLQILESTRSGACETEVKTAYHVDYEKSWEDQAPYCQLPQSVQTTYREWDGESVARQRSETTLHTFDDYGNPLVTVHADGVEEINTYYPVTGTPGKAPPMRSGMVSLLESRTLYPAGLGQDAQGGAPVLSTRYEYADLPSLIEQDPPYPLVIREQLTDASSACVLETTVQRYLTSPREHYGRIERSTTTLAGPPVTTRYEYEKVRFCEQTALQTTTIIEGHPTDPVQHSQTCEIRSLLTGLVLRQTSPAGVHTDYQYDGLGRVTSSVMAAGTQYQATTTCNYHLGDDFVRKTPPRTAILPGMAPSAWKVVLDEVDVSGRHKYSWLDGSGRVRLEQLEDSVPQPPLAQGNPMRDVYAAAYDALGREIASIVQDWAAGEQLVRRHTSTTYGPWGNVERSTTADGVTTHTRFDPIALRTERYKTANGKPGSLQVELTNINGSPIQTQLYDDGAGDSGKRRLVRTTLLQRDGLDRIIEQRVESATEPPRITLFTYDGYSRTVTQTQAGDDAARTITWVYAPHSDGDHPELINVQATENP